MKVSKKLKNKCWSALLIGVSMVFFCSCWEYDPKKVPSPPPPPSVKIDIPQPVTLSKGSLYKDGGYYFSVSDHKAHQVGDIITIKIVESYQSSSSVSEQTSKSSSSEAGIGTVLGYENKINKIFPYATPSTLFKGSMGASTSGQGKVSRQSKIVATITARVIKVLPNGNLVIQGVKTIKRNKDLEYITLTGIVRPEDIASDNSVLSTQIADAYIEYSGKGPSSEATSGPGVITRLLELLWIF
jgi:flagellar L-ring protein precursor FlgH